MRRQPLWVALGTVAGAVLGFAIGWMLASGDIGKDGDWRGGAQRFIGFAGAIGAFVGFVIAVRLTRGKYVTRDGFTLSYKRIESTAKGYREMETLALSDLLDGLRAVGYAPEVQATDEVGEVRGAADPTSPLAGANVRITDAGVKGSIRLQLAPPPEGSARALGLVEIWSERGDSTEELALFALRVLDGLVGELTAARESSALSQDPVSLLTAGLADRPRHRG
jgi:hypothetical protein